MMFDEDEYTYEAILQRMLDTISDTIDKREGSIIYDALAPAAAELAQAYIWLENAINLVFADTSVGEYLDRLCAQIGIHRKEATPATRKGSFYNENEEPMNIEIGNRFTCEGIYWFATEKISDGIYKMQCETKGIIGNNISGSLLPVDYIEYLGTAKLTELLIPGEDEEDDDTLRERYFTSSNNNAFGGNIENYKEITKKLNGVGAVKVIPCWNGGGTVKLIILDSNYSKASDLVVSTVQEVICPNKEENGVGLAPIRTSSNSSYGF